MKGLAIPRTDGRPTIWVDVPFTKAPTASTTGDLELTGYASTWGMDRDDEMVARTAFDRSLSPYLAKNPMLLWQHSMDWPIGRITGAHTDDNGLFVVGLVPNPGPDAADWQKGAYTAIKTGVVRTFSIGGYMTREVKAGPDGPVFVISEVELFEISAVSIPANPDSVFEAAVKALNGDRPRLHEKATAQMEQLLGFKNISDPELLGMDADERRERFGQLKQMFVNAYGVEPPGMDDFRRILKAREAGVSPVKLATATILVSKAFYSPEEQPSAADEKAGRAISAANRTKLEAALKSHGEMADHLVDAAESMKAAAGAHAEATSAVKDVLGITDDDPEEPEPDPDASEEPEEDDKAVGRTSQKVLTSDLYRQLRSAGAERFGQPAPGQQRGSYVYVDDFDLDEGYVVYCVMDPDDGDETLWRVPILRGADGSIALGDEAAEVEQTTSYRPKAVTTSDPAPPPAPAAPAPTDTKAADVEEEGDDDLEATLFAQAEFQKDLAEGALVASQVGVGTKAALSLANLPIADRDRGWDATAAKGRVHTWAKKPGDGGYDPAKLSKAYLWRDKGAATDQVTSYRFLVADLVDGDLAYVPRAVLAAANVVGAERGGAADEIAKAIKPLVKTLHGRMAKQFDDDALTVPWED